MKRSVNKSFPYWHRRRHLVQALILCTFLFLPQTWFFENGLLRVNFNEWKVYFFGAVLVPGTLHIITWTIVFFLFCLTVSSTLYSKVFCGWVCPQNIFYEMFDGIQRRLKKRYPRYRRSPALHKWVDMFLALAWGLLLAFTVLQYFEGAHPIFKTAAFSFVLLFFFYDTAFLKHKFCKNACPYAYLQKSFQDTTSLHVAWEQREGSPCHVCTACVKACYVDLDIRKQTYHLDCTMCGACVDACERVFSTKPEPSLLKFSFESKEGAKKKFNFFGINSWVKVFIVTAFIAYTTFALWMIINRPHTNFHVFNVTGGTSQEQGPFLLNGKHSFKYSMRLANLRDETVDYTIALNDSRFSVLWEGELEALHPLDPFEKLSFDFIVQWNDSQETPPWLTPLEFQLIRTNDQTVVSNATVYFRPVP